MRLMAMTFLALAVTITVPSAASAQTVATTETAPYCRPGQAPRFVLGFAALAVRLGDTMGNPLECEHVHEASGDTHQRTTTGLAYYRPETNTAILTDGWHHWALVEDRIVTWAGRSADPPSVASTLIPTDPPSLVETVHVPGRIIGTLNVRRAPRVARDTVVRQATHNSPVWIEEAVRGADGDIWYRIGADEYVHSSGVRIPRAPRETHAGRWIDVDLTIPTMVTAYEGDRAVYSALAIPGTEAFETPTGRFQILRRVANETMDSSTIGIPRESPGGYFLEDVLYTQYFTRDGASLHYNWWKGSFGYPGSHGCLGLSRADARWFWEWAAVGTPLVIRD
jgi:lipoprotein-anchoring transpeptidase ErfK/SrfK